MTENPQPTADELRILAELENKVLWLASWTIHHANHLRENDDGVKVGGHQASSASLATIMTALYFRILRPQDRVAVKPHASPIYHAIQYLLGRQTRQKLEAFRGYKGAQSYPSRTKDLGDVDFSTGSVGLGVAQTLFSSLVQDYVRAHGWGLERPEGRMIALVGDAELDEGNIFEAILEGWKQGLRNCWWIIDYNRQSLDAVIREGLWARYEALFKAFGWDVVILKYGSLLNEAFREPGGERLREWIDNCPNQLYSALVFQGGAAWRRRLNDEIGDQGPVTRLIEARSDDELARLMTNLAGHDLSALLDAFGTVDHDRPICFICYTIKGFALPFAGHKDNHAGLMTPAQTESLRAVMNIRPGHEWEKFEGLSTAPAKLQRFLDGVPFAAADRRHRTARIAVPAELPVTMQPVMSTQAGFGALLNELGRGESEIADRVVTTSPDVTVDQSRRLGQPSRPVRARENGRYIQERAHSFNVPLGLFAQRPAYRARHRRDEPVHPVVRARALARDQRRAADPDRHAVRPLHPARARCAQLCMLPGRPLHSGGDALGHHARARGRGASVDRHAAHRAGAGRARRLRARLRRRARDHSRLRLRLHPARGPWRSVRAQLAA
jgi:pyruvate dehydrogenase E1 component